MATYYVDSRAPLHTGDGLSPQTAVTSYRALTIQPGDTVLFRRGSVFRDALHSPDGTPDALIRYGAYGEGEKPAFWGSVDLSSPDGWQETAPNVWQYALPLVRETCNLIFNHGESCGVLAWNIDLLNVQGKWHDTRIGMTRNGGCAGDGTLLLYSVGNPGSVYQSIECAYFDTPNLLVRANRYVVFEDLAFRYGGVHGFQAANAHDIVMTRCDFAFIGGGVWNRERRIRFGNAFELWDDCHDVTMQECTCTQVYDSCVTHQGPRDVCVPGRNLRFIGNRFEKYGMGAYEARDKVTIDGLFENNVCLDAGLGFSLQDETPPRRSEIWPQPMGHHLFIWRMPKATEGGNFIVRGNTFGAAPYGAAVYSIISPEAEAQFHFSRNRYVFSPDALAMRWGGKNYTGAQFALYQQESAQDTDSTLA